MNKATNILNNYYEKNHIIILLIFGLTANVCNYLSPQEKCMEDNACRNRA
ncbi:hypothetical protein LEP1GSC132_2052 [Leptospira kirschneri str. 200803703]|nr:hypothetical protein LEP1GSC042_1583 [Leptospira kirschneri serovar Bim str. PUO 1247]EMN05468.1 hypothetical protein LEP1GSC046_2108 [Leptospira kirschneri serovar Bim str. 1051]EMN24989.1 hypothetical protein LEP1GSC065_2137 [Leptospira kirschneri serovar Sokoine str. RM1]EMO65604.1 hypothetical protein LEP1GSC132_2052 [Leptospira kirschneri str. 200803703]